MTEISMVTDQGIKVEIISMVKGLTEIEECRPKLTKAYVPDWWKSIPAHMPDSEFKNAPERTVKVCPSFPDYFSQGFVIPAWADFILCYDEEKDWWYTKAGQSTDYVLSGHGNKQMVDYVKGDIHSQGILGSFIFKAQCPWRIKTPQGYSVYQLPMFYHFNNDFSVLPGIIDTDMHWEVNQQILYHGNNKEVFIKRGTPLAQYIPFKRQKTELEVRYQTEEDIETYTVQDLDLHSKFAGQYLARRRALEKELEN